MSVPGQIHCRSGSPHDVLGGVYGVPDAGGACADNVTISATHADPTHPHTIVIRRIQVSTTF